MKLVVTGTIVALIAVLIYFFMQTGTEQISPNHQAEADDGNAQSNGVTSQLPSKRQPVFTDPSEGQVAKKVIDQTLIDQVEQAKTQMDELIAQYNENLQNPTERARIQSKIDKLMKKYNELVLPVALEQINGS